MSTALAPMPSAPRLDILSLINQWTLLGIAGVAVAEQTKTSESTGASKFKTAMDIIKNEAGLVNQVDPALGALANVFLTPIINGIVLVNNSKGLFSHKVAAAPAPVASAPAE
jgi:hypothetical protein